MRNESSRDSSGKGGELSLIAYNTLPNTDERNGADRKIYVYPRTELDESEVLVKFSLLSYSCIGDYAPGHCSGNLTDRNAVSRRSDYADGGALIILARLRKPCGIEPACMMAHIGDPPFYRKPVGMHVDGRHEDRYLERLSLYELMLHCPLYDHYLSIDGTDHHVLAGTLVASGWTTEKVEHEGIHHHRQRGEHCRKNPWRQKEPYGYIEGKQNYCQQYEDIRSFAVYLVFQI